MGLVWGHLSVRTKAKGIALSLFELGSNKLNAIPSDIIVYFTSLM